MIYSLRVTILASLALLTISAAGYSQRPYPSSDTLTSNNPFNGQAREDQIIQEGNARFTVLTPRLIRLEYDPERAFTDRPTFHVLKRKFPQIDFTTSVKNGWRIIKTSHLIFKYKRNSGPFRRQNTKVSIIMGESSLEVDPRWNRYRCTYNSICQAETARLINPLVKSGEHISGDWISNRFLNYTGTGYVNSFSQKGSTVKWNMEKVPEKREYSLHIRYALDDRTSDITLIIDGQAVDTVNFTNTVDHENWRIAKSTITLDRGSHTVALRNGNKENPSVQLDFLSVTPQHEVPEPYKPVTYRGNLGGWDRGLGNQTGEIHLHDGLLSKEGWYLLDDTRTPVWPSRNSWVQPRGKSRAYQDTYLFGYGHDFKEALGDFADITGHPPLLPRWAFGIMFSRNHPYGADDFKNEVVKNQRKNNVPLDGLIIDTDFKAPDRWNGWNWREELFPSPRQFLKWTRDKGLKVGLNIHPSINHNDPHYQKANEIAGGLVEATGECPRWQGMQDSCSVWNWGVEKHARSYFTLHEQFEKQGVDFWWLDWCCDGSRVTVEGLTPDAWINQQYALHLEKQGKRGFSLSRMGSKWQNQSMTRPGPWAEHRNTIHFTGDTYPTWDMLRFQSKFTASEGNIGMTYVSHDIGSYHAGGPRSDELSDHKYIRWIQFGTFQPIFRSHGHGKRLPWQFKGKAREIAADFMRLRQSIIPYLYTEAYRSHKTGIPIVRSMYLEHPGNASAYQHQHQYYFGPELLVAPVAQPGDTVEKTIWLPKGQWVNYFTGETHKGDQTIDTKVSLTRVPVYARAGAIIPHQPYMDYVGQKRVDPLTLKIFHGDDGRYTLYEDRGESHGYRQDYFQKTPIRFQQNTENSDILTINPVRGKGYDGDYQSRDYRIVLISIDEPDHITIGEEKIEQTKPGNRNGWWYKEKQRRLVIYVEDVPSAAQTVLRIID